MKNTYIIIAVIVVLIVIGGVYVYAHNVSTTVPTASGQPAAQTQDSGAPATNQGTY